MNRTTIVYPSYWEGNINHYGDIQHNRFTVSDPPTTLCGINTNHLSKQPADPSPLHWFDCATCKERAVQVAVELGDADRDGGGTSGEARR